MQKNDGIELTVVVPTYNEKGNCRELVARIEDNLKDVKWEIIFVDDDSPDGTADEVKSIAQTKNSVRCLKRIKRRGLSSACIEGGLASTAPYIAVVDADLQHDVSILPQMLKALKEDNLDVVVGSRYVEGGGTQDWEKSRLGLSRLATFMSQKLLKVELTDPMSGFFLIKRSTFDQVVHQLSGVGFKILLDIFTTSKVPLRFKEIPYQFQNRFTGESKLDPHVMWDYLMLLGDKLLHRMVPIRFLSFSIIGGLGVFVHFAVLIACIKLFNISFPAGQTIAALTAIAANFSLNNLLTYRDKCLKGWRWVFGLFTFYLVCSLGAIANIAVATYLFNFHFHWYIAAFAGIVVGAVWNYALSSVYTWD